MRNGGTGDSKRPTDSADGSAANLLETMPKKPRTDQTESLREKLLAVNASEQRVREKLQRQTLTGTQEDMEIKEEEPNESQGKRTQKDNANT